MKTILSITLVLLFTVSSFAQEKTKVETLKTFLDGIVTIETANIDEAAPLAGIKTLADSKADKKIIFTKENIQSAMDEIGKYKSALIIVGLHTIVKITDAPNCQQSGSWGACMPFGKGLIQKAGSLEPKEGYINFIIGIPDSQERTLYLFN